MSTPRVRGEQEPLTPTSAAREVERAWFRIKNRTVPSKCPVYVSRRGKVAVSQRPEIGEWEYVGTYTCAVELRDLKADVFNVWDGMHE